MKGIISVLQAYILIQAETARVEELVEELAHMQLDATVIKDIRVVTGQYDLIALVEAPDLKAMSHCIIQGISNAVGIRHTETCLIIP